MKITVWKCEHTGKLFEDVDLYRKHLRKLGRARRETSKLAVIAGERDSWWAEAYNTEMSIDEFPNWVIANQDRFWQEAKTKSWDWDKVGKTRRSVVCPVPRLLEFTVWNVRPSMNVSNSHGCPHNGVTNWGGRVEGAPRGYPGWQGRVEWLVAWRKEWDGVYIGGDLFREGRTRARTGTGGGGHMRWSDQHKCYVQSYGYEFQMFAADWPGIIRHIAKQQTLEIVAGTRKHTDFDFSQLLEEYAV
jgi:hypothetical protein